MGPHALVLSRQIQVVIQGVFSLGRVLNVAGVTERRFHDLARLAHLVHGHLHVFGPVEAIEYPEHIDARGGGFLNEKPDHIVRVVLVAHRVGGAQQHLLHDVGHGRAQFQQAFPRIFAQEAQRHIEGGSAPGLDGKQSRHGAGVTGGDGHQVPGAHPGRQQRLVRIAESGVRNQGPALRLDPVSQSFRALHGENLFGGPRAFVSGHRRQDGFAHEDRGRFSLQGRVAVHDHIGDESKQPLSLAPSFVKLEQFRGLINEARVVVPGLELGMRQELQQERQVGRDAADAKLHQGAPHPADAFIGVVPASGHLH